MPSMGSVSNSNITRILMDGIRLIARRGRRTRTVRIADRFKLPTAGRYSMALIVWYDRHHEKVSDRVSGGGQTQQRR